MSKHETATEAVVIERTFDAPIALVWQMWTDPALFAAWYGPTGVDIAVSDMDLRVGGERRICMQFATPEGTRRMWFTGRFLHIEAPTRLVYSETMGTGDGDLDGDGDGAAADAQQPVTEVSIELAEADGRTRMVLTHRGIPAGSPGEAGWQMALDELGRQLANR